MTRTIERRDFLYDLVTAITGAYVAMAVSPKQETMMRGEMPFRTLGRTGEKVSCIGLGGFHLGQSRLEEADALKLFQARSTEVSTSRTILGTTTRARAREEWAKRSKVAAIKCS
jgi:hypothetical protein